MDLDYASQLLFDGIVAGSIFALLGSTFGLVSNVTQRFHIAYTSTYVASVYVGIWFYDTFLVQIGVAILVGLAFAVVFGMLIEGLVYVPVARKALRRGNDPLIPVFVASLGITIVTSNLIALQANTQPRSFNIVELDGMSWGPVRLTNLSLITIVVCWALVLALTAFINHTKRGRWINAVRVNPVMASVVGINPRRVFYLVFAIASFASGVLGMLESTQSAATPAVGFSAVFYGVVASFVAGIEASPVRIGVVGLIIGLVQSLSAIWLDLQWAQLVVFSILLVYLIVLPTDIPRRVRALLPASAQGAT